MKFGMYIMLLEAFLTACFIMPIAVINGKGGGIPVTGHGDP
jgi:hypothetical protein